MAARHRTGADAGQHRQLPGHTPSGRARSSRRTPPTCAPCTAAAREPLAYGRTRRASRVRRHRRRRVLRTGCVPRRSSPCTSVRMPAVDALAAASWRAREWLGRPGLLEEGAPADFCRLPGPTRCTDLGVLAAPSRIVLRGRSSSGARGRRSRPHASAVHRSGRTMAVATKPPANSACPARTAGEAASIVGGRIRTGSSQLVELARAAHPHQPEVVALRQRVGWIFVGRCVDSSEPQAALTPFRRDPGSLRRPAPPARESAGSGGQMLWASSMTMQDRPVAPPASTTGASRTARAAARDLLQRRKPPMSSTAARGRAAMTSSDDSAPRPTAAVEARDSADVRAVRAAPDRRRRPARCSQRKPDSPAAPPRQLQGRLYSSRSSIGSSGRLPHGQRMACPGSGP